MDNIEKEDFLEFAKKQYKEIHGENFALPPYIVNIINSINNCKDNDLKAKVKIDCRDNKIFIDEYMKKLEMKFTNTDIHNVSVSIEVW
jgi:hypothetical protein